MKIGRNEPCPCGSGKKYKKCCLALDEQRAREHAHAGEQAHACHFCGTPATGHGYTDMADLVELDALSNRANDLTHAGRLDEAEAIGLDLLKRFPYEIDGLDRLADLYAARGDLPRAVEYYRKAANFATVNEGFDAESVRWYLDEARRLEKQLKR